MLVGGLNEQFNGWVQSCLCSLHFSIWLRWLRGLQNILLGAAVLVQAALHEFKMNFSTVVHSSACAACFTCGLFYGWAKGGGRQLHCYYDPSFTG
jgi:hypothetical protein